MITPINTYYNGNYFRSRLEAKWAVFFDTLNVIYEYEKEGYVLSNGHCYLPDFYFPELDLYGEVKPAYLHRNFVDEKWKHFVYDGGKSLYVLWGNIGEIEVDYHNPYDEGYFLNGVPFAHLQDDDCSGHLWQCFGDNWGDYWHKEAVNYANKYRF